MEQLFNLKTIYIKEGVTSLNYGSLYLCENLEEVNLSHLEQII